MNSPSKNILEFFSGASSTGKKHLDDGTPNQDAFLCSSYPFGTVLVVADGVGSELYSHIGSRAVVEGVHKTFCKYHDGNIDSTGIPESIMEHYIAGIDKEYRKSASTTCIYAAIIYEKGLFLGQVGDGICCGKINGESFILQQKDDEFSNVVRSLSAVNGQAEWTEAYIPFEQIDSIHLMLSSDGVSEDLLPGKECDFVEFVISKLSDLLPNKRTEYLCSMLNNWSTPQSNDDKTFCFYSLKKGER